MATPKRGRLVLIGAILALAAVFGLLAYNRRTPSAAGDHTVRIATFSTAIDYAPFYVARSLGLFQRELASVGAKPAFTSFESLPPLNDSLRAGQLDVVFEAEPPALIAEAADTDIYVPVVSAVLRQQIIVRKGSPVRRVADLAGRSVGVLTGTSSHFGLVEALRRAGVPLERVRVVNLAPAEARAAFQSGGIDAWAIWPPFPEAEVEAGRAVALPESEAPIVSMAVMRGGFVKTDRRAADAVDRAIVAAKAYIAAHPDESMRLVAQAVGQPLPVVRRAWPQHDFRATADAEVQAQVQRASDFLQRGDYLPRRVDVSRELFHEE